MFVNKFLLFQMRAPTFNFSIYLFSAKRLVEKYPRPRIRYNTCVKKVSHLPSQLGIFVFTFTVNRFHIYGALLHLALKVFTFTRPYYIFTFRGAPLTLLIYLHSKHLKQTLSPDMVFYLEQLKKHVNLSKTDKWASTRESLSSGFPTMHNSIKPTC